MPKTSSNYLNVFANLIFNGFVLWNSKNDESLFTRLWMWSKNARMCFFVLCSDIDECKGSEEVCPGHACINQVGSYRCECATGYNFNSISRTCEGLQLLCCLSIRRIPFSLNAWKFVLFFLLFFSDVNECRYYPGRLCAHKCENTLGSYKCSCTSGFKLANDGRNCDGKGVRELM